MSAETFVRRERRAPKEEPILPPVPREVHARLEAKYHAARMALDRVVDTLRHAKDWKQDAELIRAAERAALTGLTESA